MSRRLVVALGALALVVVFVMIAVLVRTLPQDNANPTPEPSPTSTSTKPAQDVMLTAVRSDAGEIAGGVLMGTNDAATSGSWLSLQPGLSLDVNLQGDVTLAAEGPWSPNDSANSVGDQLNVDVTGGWVMDRLAFAAMVDTVGGVVVNSPTKVTAVGPDGKTVTVAKKGTHRLYGPQAAAYVITLSPGEQQPARMARFDEVWSQVIMRLPGNVDRVRSIVGTLGSSSRIAGLAPEDIAIALLTYQTAMVNKATIAGVTPVTQSGTGAAAIYTQQAAEAVPVIEKLFAEAISVPGENGAQPRVRVYGAGIENAQAVQIRNAVFAAKFTFVWGGSVAPSSTTDIVVGSQEHVVLYGDPIAEALSLPATAVTVAPARTIGAQSTVYAGLNALAPTPAATPDGTNSASPAVSGMTP